MKTLTIIRHAKSSWKDSGLQDFDRPLNQRGRRDAPVMATAFRDPKRTPQRILSSPARRAVDTLAEFLTVAGPPPVPVDYDRRLYLASAPDLLERIAALEPHVEHAAVVGHNPGLTDLVNLLSGADIENLPTCAVVRLELDIASWANAAPGRGSVLELDYPKRRSKNPPQNPPQGS